MKTKSKFEQFKMLTNRPSIKEIIELFGVCERTARRWQQKLDEYHPNERYCPGKINKKIAVEIRGLDRSGNYTQKKLAEIYGISQPMIGKIVNNLAYRTGITGTADARIKS
jgi:predicted XRE-type DNA-binding protein